ncbi:hypothetical protein SmJEL517_g06175 [Synchytrium microbalum]|uniref:Profilin n=1 Tax=Synchytrium microbalum TaxID=1806994 RepID=A0A507BRR4_9FUNG|nr:uncharacterized protein SmJEL517_g06175 [Synchytrium microbalum]TPX30208.1 hypothetical protein SmJEL517_g06175 [Synchytrium microbalum]
MSQAEWVTLETSFNSPAVARGTGQNDGVFFMGKQYRAVRADKMSVYAKNAQGGILCAKTTTHYVVAAYDAEMYASVAVEAVEKLAAYLRTKNK